MISQRGVTRILVAGALLAVMAQVAMILAPPDMAVIPGHTSMLSVHLLLELVAVVVALSIVTVAWHTHDLADSRSADILIAGFLVVASCDLVHALTYDGMPDLLGPPGTERAIFFWLAGRTVEVITVATAVLTARPKEIVPRSVALSIGVVLSALFVAWGSYGIDYFPQTFVKGAGVTPFKAEYEVLLFLANTLLAVWFWRHAVRSGQSRFHILALSAWVIGVGELSFTQYVQPSDFQNIFGHVYKLIGYVLMYWAVFIVRIRAPFDALRVSEARAVEGERRLRSLSDNLPNCFIYQIIQERDGRFRYFHVGEAIVSVVGLDVESVMADANALFKQVWKEDQAAFRTARALAVERFAVMDWSGRVRHRDGRMRWMQIVSAPRRLADGRVAWDGLVTDITERRVREEQHRENEAMLAAVIDSASDAVISTDVDGRVTLFNPAAERIFGRPASALLGQDLQVLLPARARQAHGGDMAGFARSGISSRRMGSGRVQGVRADQSELELDASISQVTVNDKQILTAILRDVTDRVRSERELLQYRQELTDLTRQLMEQEKQTSRRLAQMLHDQLGQTLTAMRIDFVSEASLSDPLQAARHARVDASIDQAIREVRQVLVDLRPTLLDELGLYQALDNEMRTRQRAAQDVRLRLEAAPDLTSQRWRGDVEYAAFMVAREAIANALRHARPSLVQVRLGGAPDALRLEIRDDGSGLAPADMVARPGHLGIIGMRERSTAIGGHFELCSGPEGGTMISLTWKELAA